MDMVKSKYPKLVDFIGQNFGHGIGMEFRESISIINEKNEHEVQENMVMMVGINLTGL